MKVSCCQPEFELNCVLNNISIFQFAIFLNKLIEAWVFLLPLWSKKCRDHAPNCHTPNINRNAQSLKCTAPTALAYTTGFGVALTTQAPSCLKQALFKQFWMRPPCNTQTDYLLWNQAHLSRKLVIKKDKNLQKLLSFKRIFQKEKI